MTTTDLDAMTRPCGWVHAHLSAADLDSLTTPLRRVEAEAITAVHEVLVAVDTTSGPVDVSISGGTVGSQAVQALANLLSSIRHRQGGSGYVSVYPSSEGCTLTVGALEAS